jgi:hypothetical protein
VFFAASETDPGRDLVNDRNQVGDSALRLATDATIFDQSDRILDDVAGIVLGQIPCRIFSNAFTSQQECTLRVAFGARLDQ